MGGVDAAGRDEPGGGFGGCPPFGHRLQEPELLAARAGVGRVEGLHRRAQEARRRPPLDSATNILF